MTEEAKLVAAETGGLMPESDGWFVLGAKDARWLVGELGAYCNFEPQDVRFEQVGLDRRGDDRTVPLEERGNGEPRCLPATGGADDRETRLRFTSEKPATASAEGEPVAIRAPHD